MAGRRAGKDVFGLQVPASSAIDSFQAVSHCPAPLLPKLSYMVTRTLAASHSCLPCPLPSPIAGYGIGTQRAKAIAPPHLRSTTQSMFFCLYYGE